MILANKEKLHDFLLFNFLAKDRQNAEDILTAGNGFVVPGIVASDYENSKDGILKVEELKKAADVISVGLGGGGNPDNWKKVLEIAEGSQPGHINQPFEKSSYAAGYLQSKGITQDINGLVAPAGKVGFVKLAGSIEMRVVEFVELALALGVQSIKFMPANGLNHLDELVFLCKVAADRGIQAIEPAGGITSENIGEMIHAVRDTGIPLFMPHIFGSTIDRETGKTIPAKVEKIMTIARR